MKTRLTAGLLALALLVAALAAVASAATEQTGTISHGKLNHYSWNKDKKVGHLTLKKSGKKKKYNVPETATCGEQRGYSGDPIKCKDLGKDKYHGKPTTVRWTKNDSGKRVASFVSVNITK